MAQRKPINIFSIFNWALLTVGISQIAFKVFGPIQFVFAVGLCSCFYGFFLVKSPDTKGSPQSISIALLCCSVKILMDNLLFSYLIFVDWNNGWIVLHLMASGLFFGVGLLLSLMFSKIFHVA
ncbi:hypothetical protein D4L85_23335 [Chryseolinea soli]|uniref:Uncharacterized protein n=1 Tax=Chryseolinea soli TaxID=2321403 RepID=A0A385SX54_9BACT|nr:hypothetical protein D4L85_23335 [Chryseolinea soli]